MTDAYLEEMHRGISHDLIRIPDISCDGQCGRKLRENIVVLEYAPTSTLLFFCPSCANNRMILDLVARKCLDVDNQEIIHRLGSVIAKVVTGNTQDVDNG